MLRHIVTDLHEHYVNEVLKPKLGSPAGQSTAEGPGKGGPADGGVNQGSEKRIRQAVYDIRYRARREEIPLQSAFTQYMAHTSMNAMEKKAVREKLGLDRPGGGGAAAPGGGGEKPGADTQREEVEISEEGKLQKFKVRVTDKESGKTYVRMATREKIAKLRSNPFISSVEMTKYGKTYEGGEDEPDKAKKDYDGDGKVESGAKEYRGVIHNKIQQKKGGKPDGNDTSSVKEALSTDIENPNDLKNAVKKAVKRIDTNVSGDVNKKDKSMGEFGEFIPSPDGKKKVTTMLKMGDSFNEEFSNWRDDLNSYDEEHDGDVVKEMPRGKKNKVKFNPEVAIESLVIENGGKIISVEELSEEKPYERIDRLSRERVAKQKAAKAAEEKKRTNTAAAFQAHKREILAKGGRHVDALDSWHKKQMKEAKVDKLLPDYERSAARNARYDNPDGALALGGGIQRSRRAAHRERDEMNKDKKDVRRGKTDGPQFQGKTGAERLAKVKSELGEGKSDWRSELNLVDEKMNLATADMGDVIKDFYKSDAPQFKGKTKEEIRKMAIAAKLEAERGIDEVTRYAKETGKDFVTGKPSVKGGNPPPEAMKHIEKSLRDTGGLMSSRRKPIQPQGKKKVRGEKGPKGVTPVDRIKGKIAQKRAPKPDIGSRFD